MDRDSSELDQGARSGTGDETAQWPARLRPDTLGETFGGLFYASVAAFFLSLMGLVLYLAYLPEENPTIPATAPPVIALVASWFSILISVICYGIWSAWQLRTLSPDRDAYDRRQRRTAWAVAGVLIWLLFTAGMLFGSPPE